MLQESFIISEPQDHHSQNIIVLASQIVEIWKRHDQILAHQHVWTPKINPTLCPSNSQTFNLVTWSCIFANYTYAYTQASHFRQEWISGHMPRTSAMFALLFLLAAEHAGKLALQNKIC